MSGYELSRQWFDFVFENPEKTSTAQTALYMWLIEANNRKGFSEKFVFNTQDAIDYTGIRNRKTIWIALNELVENGFVTIVNKAKNQQELTVLSIINNKVESNGCLDRALVNRSLSEKRTDDYPCSETATTLADGLADGLATGHSLKQQTTNNKHSFEQFWDAYDKKKDAKKCKARWDKIKDSEKEKILAHVPLYVKSTPDVTFRKNPLTYLNGECWNDQIPQSKPDTTIPLVPGKSGIDMSAVDPYNKPWELLGTDWYKKVFPKYWDQMSMEGILEYNIGAKTYQLACPLPEQYKLEPYRKAS